MDGRKERRRWIRSGLIDVEIIGQKTYLVILIFGVNQNGNRSKDNFK